MRSLGRWSLILAGTALAALAAVAGLNASSASLAEVPPQEIVAGIISSHERVDAFSGVVHLEQGLVPPAMLDSGGRHPDRDREYRIWYKRPGKVRVEELQLGGRVYVSDGATSWLYSPGDNTVVVSPSGHAGSAGMDRLPARMGRIVSRLHERLEQSSVVSVSTGSVAGREAYVVEARPEASDLLVGRQVVAADGTPKGAPRYFPLQYVLEDRSGSAAVTIEFASISYGAVAEERFTFEVQPGMEVISKEPAEDRKAARTPTPSMHDEVTLEEAGELATFPVRAPAEVPGGRRLTRATVQRHDSGSTVVLRYGSGWGNVLVVQSDRAQEGDGQHAGAMRVPGSGPDGPASTMKDMQALLRDVDVDGAAGKLLETEIWTALAWEKDGVAYVVAGSFPPDVLRALAASLQ